jgi:hypothetical protein
MRNAQPIGSETQPTGEDSKPNWSEHYTNWRGFHNTYRPISVYRFPRRALALYPQLCMGIPAGARFVAQSADALPATLYGHFTQTIYSNRPIPTM